MEWVEVGGGVRRSGQLSRKEATAQAGGAEGGGHTSSMAGGPPAGVPGSERVALMGVLRLGCHGTGPTCPGFCSLAPPGSFSGWVWAWEEIAAFPQGGSGEHPPWSHLVNPASIWSLAHLCGKGLLFPEGFCLTYPFPGARRKACGRRQAGSGVGPAPAPDTVPCPVLRGAGLPLP